MTAEPANKREELTIKALVFKAETVAFFNECADELINAKKAEIVNEHFKQLRTNANEIIETMNKEYKNGLLVQKNIDHDTYLYSPTIDYAMKITEVSNYNIHKTIYKTSVLEDNADRGAYYDVVPFRIFIVNDAKSIVESDTYEYEYDMRYGSLVYVEKICDNEDLNERISFNNIAIAFKMDGVSIKRNIKGELLSMKIQMDTPYINGCFASYSKFDSTVNFIPKAEIVDSKTNGTILGVNLGGLPALHGGNLITMYMKCADGIVRYDFHRDTYSKTLVNNDMTIKCGIAGPTYISIDNETDEIIKKTYYPQNYETIDVNNDSVQSEYKSRMDDIIDGIYKKKICKNAMDIVNSFL